MHAWRPGLSQREKRGLPAEPGPHVTDGCETDIGEAYSCVYSYVCSDEKAVASGVEARHLSYESPSRGSKSNISCCSLSNISPPVAHLVTAEKGAAKGLGDLEDRVILLYSARVQWRMTNMAISPHMPAAKYLICRSAIICRCASMACIAAYEDPPPFAPWLLFPVAPCPPVPFPPAPAPPELDDPDQAMMPDYGRKLGEAVS